MPDLDVVSQSRTYILGSGEDFFGIWDKRDPNQPLERFPPTEEGFERARSFSRTQAPRAVGAGDLADGHVDGRVAGSLLWVGAGLLAAAVTTVTFIEPPERSFPVLVGVFTLMDQVGFRVTVGGVLGLLALLLVRWERRTRPADLAPTDAEAAATDVVEGQLGQFSHSCAER